jgi:pyruvate kinase
MLNKGPYVVDTVRFLGDVLRRMQEHTSKKRSLLRRLRVAGAPPPTGRQEPQSDAVTR